jgi:hypothetical protein
VAPVPDVVSLSKAELREIRLPDGDRDAQEVGQRAAVDFNPESLRVTYSNSFEGKDQRGGAARQFVTKSSTKLSVELWFDVTKDPDAQDVRERTKHVNHFMVPKEERKGKEKQYVPPGVRFSWGSFLFDGVMESMDETLDFFSPEGRPLRAKVAISISSQEIQFQIQPAPTPGAGGGTPGTEPRQQVRENESVQQAMAQSGNPEHWPQVAEANGIENPRRPPAGSFIDTSTAR